MEKRRPTVPTVVFLLTCETEAEETRLVARPNTWEAERPQSEETFLDHGERMGRREGRG